MINEYILYLIFIILLFCLYISPLIIITSFQVIIITTQIKKVQKATLLSPNFAWTVIFAQKRCTKIKPTIFAHDGCAKIKTYVFYPVGKNMFKVRKITIERRSKNVQRIIASNKKKKGIKLKILLVHSSQSIIITSSSVILRNSLFSVSSLTPYFFYKFHHYRNFQTSRWYGGWSLFHFTYSSIVNKKVTKPTDFSGYMSNNITFGQLTRHLCA